MTLPVLERNAAITGVGASQIGRNIGKPPLELTLDAVFAALADAGLTPADIDGLATTPGWSQSAGMAPVPMRDLKNGLGLKLNWFSSMVEAPSTMTTIFNAAMAVATGQARHVLCYRTATEDLAKRQRKRAATSSATKVNAPAPTAAPARRWEGWQAWAFPFNAVSPVHANAMLAKVRMEKFGLTREQLGAWAVNCRRNAALNPSAVYRDPMTLDDYLSARMIADPLCMFDCDAPIDSSIAVIVSARETARDLRKPPLRIEAMSGALHGRDSWDQYEDIAGMAANDAGRHLWERSGLKPTDVDLANLYDGFSIQGLVWLEALGFCGRGESGPFIEGGRRIALEGELPLNTGGGQLSGGRSHGFGLLRETCLQLWGEGGQRQVPNSPEVGVVGVGGGAYGGCLILTRS